MCNNLDSILNASMQTFGVCIENKTKKKETKTKTRHLIKQENKISNTCNLVYDLLFFFVLLFFF